MSEATTEEKKSGLSKTVFSKMAIVLILVVAVIASMYFYIQYQRNQKFLQNPTLAGLEETKALVSKVSKIIELPTGEDPTIATVSDKSKLAGQQFFVQSQNGDKVLIYSKASKAILYRPATNKIIEVAPVVNNTSASKAQEAATSSSTLTQTPNAGKTITIAIYNGTKINGLAGAYEKKIAEEMKNVKVIKKDNANGDYTSNLVVDLTGKNSAFVKQAAEFIDGKVGDLPEAETKPDADILIIAGSEL